MSDCNPSHTPIDPTTKLGSDGTPVVDLTIYRCLAGHYRVPDIHPPRHFFCLTAEICLYMHDPESHTFRLSNGFFLYSTLGSTLTTYSNANWGGCPVNRRSTSNYCVFFGDNLVSWSSKRQHTVSRSEAEYQGLARGESRIKNQVLHVHSPLGLTNAVAETPWLRNLLRELHMPPCTATLVYCDNISAIYMPAKPSSTSTNQSYWSLPVTSFETKLPSVMFGSFTFPPAISTPASSPRDFHSNLSIRQLPLQTAWHISVHIMIPSGGSQKGEQKKISRCVATTTCQHPALRIGKEKLAGKEWSPDRERIASLHQKRSRGEPPKEELRRKIEAEPPDRER
ncbi:hypothetical protein LXL04_033376 [Taraxacum kok-saghyz]